MDKFIENRVSEVYSSIFPQLNGYEKSAKQNVVAMPKVVFITSYPPRVCGIATYSQDLIQALKTKFHSGFDLRICAVENKFENHEYPEEVDYILNTDDTNSYVRLAASINGNNSISLVVVQHEFGFFSNKNREFMDLLYNLKKPFVVAFHTVLPKPDQFMKEHISTIGKMSAGIIVMTYSSAEILDKYYGLKSDVVKVIFHGTHLLANRNTEELKGRYGFRGKYVLSTFGLLSSGKGVETSIKAMPAILKSHPKAIFLVIGKTHPSVVMKEGEIYRESLMRLVSELGIEESVIFLNYFMPLPELLEYLQLTDIYVFTSTDPDQAVSGTFSYAMSSGCPIVSTPIAHAKELINNGSGMVFDFGASDQLAEAVNTLLDDEKLREMMSSNGIHRMAPTSWENSALAHMRVFEQAGLDHVVRRYTLPQVNLQHVMELTTGRGMIQFSVLGRPDHSSGYTLDDNARALIAISEHYDQCLEPSDLVLINIYLSFIETCFTTDNRIVNYMNSMGMATDQNGAENLDDATGRMIWALGFLISKAAVMPIDMVERAEKVFLRVIPQIREISSTRAMAFAIKGLYYRNLVSPAQSFIGLVEELANRLLQMYRHESRYDWNWYEAYLTYANAVLSEAMLLAWKATGVKSFRDAAKDSFEFLNSHTFTKESIRVVSNNGWLVRGKRYNSQTFGGEQPIDVAYSIMALSTFFKEFGEEQYKDKMILAFNWFLGNNHLNQTMYNTATGGCYDGLENVYINLNQGAESTLSYLMARLEMAKWDLDVVPNDVKITEFEHQKVLN